MSVEEKEEKTEKEEDKEEPIEAFMAPEDIPSEEPLEKGEEPAEDRPGDLDASVMKVTVIPDVPAEKKPWWKFW